jgi:hypothetical protein
MIKEAAGEGGSMAGLGHAMSRATLRTAPQNAPWRPITGTAAGSAMSTGLGMLGGRYLVSPLLRYLMPDTFRNEDATNTVATIGGGLLGLGTMAPQIAQSMEHGGWFNGGPGVAPAAAPTPVKEVRADWWTESAAERAIMGGVSAGTLDPVEALQILQKNREAEVGNTGLFNSKLFGKAIGGGAGGYLGARVASSIASTLFGSKWTPEEQQNMAYQGGLAGGLLSVLGSLAGGK